MNFNHIDIQLPQLERETIDGIRYYSVLDEEDLLKLVSITSVTSYFNKEIFINWRKMPSIDIIEFGVDDIVRSGLVKEYIIAKMEAGF